MVCLCPVWGLDGKDCERCRKLVCFRREIVPCVHVVVVHAYSGIPRAAGLGNLSGGFLRHLRIFLGFCCGGDWPAGEGGCVILFSLRV